jgi:hypothetical protein
MSRDYLEKYTFDHNGNEFIVDLYHDGAGIFKDLPVTEDNSPSNELKRLINSPFIHEIPMNYHPSNELFRKLYQMMETTCCELDTQITNVIEEAEKYFVLYCLKTSGKFSMIQFYFDNKHGFTTAMPKSDCGMRDQKLLQLITQLS